MTGRIMAAVAVVALVAGLAVVAVVTLRPEADGDVESGGDAGPVAVLQDTSTTIAGATTAPVSTTATSSASSAPSASSASSGTTAAAANSPTTAAALTSGEPCAVDGATIGGTRPVFAAGKVVGDWRSTLSAGARFDAAASTREASRVTMESFAWLDAVGNADVAGPGDTLITSYRSDGPLRVVWGDDAGFCVLAATGLGPDDWATVRIPLAGLRIGIDGNVVRFRLKADAQPLTVIDLGDSAFATSAEP